MPEDSNLKESKRDPNQFGPRLEMDFIQTLVISPALPYLNHAKHSNLLIKGGIRGPQNAGDGGGIAVLLEVDLFLETDVRTETLDLNVCLPAWLNKRLH